MLIVDDNYLVASSMASVLRFAGAEVVDTASRLDEAMEPVATRASEIDAVVLDVDLAGVASYPLAEALDNAGVPYVFITGYETISPKFSHRTTFVKPVSAEALCTVIAKLTA